ncbi:mRNA capping enzyme [Mycena rebaudengoi]|nr:mRNA capping enzyme [Mycena rebaudengoi]
MSRLEPEIPGTLVARRDHESWLKDQVAKMCHISHKRFPGSQPVGFEKADLAKLETQDFWVCEKSDGVRVLLLVHTDVNSMAQAVYLIDRHNRYRMLKGLFFPHPENAQMPLLNTLVDGELVLDVDPETKLVTLRFLAFDCLVANDQNIMSRPLDKRYGRLKEWVYKPFAKMKQDPSHVTKSHPFDIQVKKVSLSYCAEEVFANIPTLQHDNDGLIYTRVDTPYSPGTDWNILKWKPVISIDFKLVLQFPPLPDEATQPNFHAKPVFLLYVWCGQDEYDRYGQLYVEDEEWEQMKLSGEQYDDRIIEVHWDSDFNHWRMMRFRDDKPHGNHRDAVERIISSIVDSVGKDTLLARSDAIKAAWKARHPEPSVEFSSAPAVLARRLPHDALSLELRYGRLATSQWSKVGGPQTVVGMHR